MGPVAIRVLSGWKSKYIRGLVLVPFFSIGIPKYCTKQNKWPKVI